MALTRRISVNRETAAPSTRASRDPARPASASATRSSRLRGPAVRRWCLAVSPSTCSANVATGQAGLSQMRRRTPARPGQAARRRPGPAGSAGTGPAPAPAVSRSHGRPPARSRCGLRSFTLPPRSSTRSRSSPLRCGNSKDSRPASLPVSSCSTTTPSVARHDQDPGDPDRDRTAVPMRNELRDREPAVSPAQPLSPLKSEAPVLPQCSWLVPGCCCWSAGCGSSSGLRSSIWPRPFRKTPKKM